MMEFFEINLILHWRVNAYWYFTINYIHILYNCVYACVHAHEFMHGLKSERESNYSSFARIEAYKKSILGILSEGSTPWLWYATYKLLETRYLYILQVIYLCIKWS